jgi:carbamoyltransferase
VAPVQEEKRTQLNGETKDLTGIELLQLKRSEVPAVTHVDCSARLQTVSEDRHERYYGLIKRFDEKTGCPIVINTSFNIRGEPIVCTPEDAYSCFLGCNMDVLVMEDVVLMKDEQTQADQGSIDAYKAKFELD